MKVFLVALLVLVPCGAAAAEENALDRWFPQENDEEEKVQISPRCAGALLAAGTALGAGAAYTLTPVTLCSFGFCSAGVAKGSFAAWWQSTMPLVAKGSLFAYLQSVAMSGGAGLSVAAGAIGGTTAAAYMKEFCSFVDEANPDSAVGIVIDGSVAAVTTAIKAKEELQTQCASSELCTATVEKGAAMLLFATDTAHKAIEHAKDECTSYSLCKSGAEGLAAAGEIAGQAVTYTRKLAGTFASGFYKGLTEEKHK